MTIAKMILALMLITLLPGLTIAALSPAPHPLFESDTVHEVRLTFEQSDWWSQLVSNYQSSEDDPPYLEASCELGPYSLASIGVRFKGNSSYTYPGDKKSFKLDINEFVSGQEVDGLDKLNLNNCFLDPSMVREKAVYELCESMGMAAGRTNYAAVYINDEYWGLYLLVEQQDQEFLESRFGSGEDGNLWKGEPYGTLEYLGASEADYYDNYELKTNEETNDWSDLVDFIDQLNNTPLAALPDSLHNRLDVNSALAMMAIDNFTVNLDSYVGRCANFYMYHRELDDRFVFTKWDQNEAFGIFNMYQYSTYQLQQLDLFWTNPQFNEERPLAERLLEIEAYQNVYFGHMLKLMSGAAEPTTLVNRMEELRDLIRPYVETDPNFMFSTSQFEICMTSNVVSGGGPGGRTIPALQTFINNRNSYLQGQIGSWTPITGLVINEVMARNVSTIADESGEYDDWIEIANSGSSAINLAGLGLTDHLEGVPDYIFPNVTLAPGEYLLVWADEQPHQGDYHAPFKLDGDGEQVFLTDGAVIIDQMTYPDLGTNLSWGRWADGVGQAQLLSIATPGAENENSQTPETVVLKINEFMAQNTAGIQDENGQFEDWVEIYNPGPDSVELGGLFLTDDLTQTTQWALPEMTLAAEGFLLVYCDNDAEDGPMHATFKLSAGGEEIGLYGRLAAGNELIDSYSFGPQTANVSQGLDSDGDGVWVLFTEPTPGASNEALSDVPGMGRQLLLNPNVPNPFNPMTTLSFVLPEAGMVRLDIFDARGARVVELLGEEVAAGSHKVVWRGQDARGMALPSGVYFSRLSFGNQHLTGRMTLVR